MIPPTVDTPLRFGPFELRPASRQLLMRRQPVAVGGRAFDLLCALAARRNRVVSHEELLELVWPGMSVEPNNLQVQVWALRKLLGARAIATVARRGYRFLPELCLPGPAADGDRPARAGTFDAPDVLDLLNRVADHRLVTLVGPVGPSLQRLALACGHRLADRNGGVLWQLDAPALADAPLIADPGPASPARPPPWAGPRADVLLLTVPPQAPAPAAQALHRLFDDAPALRLLAVAAQALGHPDEQVLPVTAGLPTRQAAGSAEGPALRWQQRGREGL